MQNPRECISLSSMKQLADLCWSICNKRAACFDAKVFYRLASSLSTSAYNQFSLGAYGGHMDWDALKFENSQKSSWWSMSRVNHTRCQTWRGINGPFSHDHAVIVCRYSAKIPMKRVAHHLHSVSRAPEQKLQFLIRRRKRLDAVRPPTPSAPASCVLKTAFMT